MTTTSAGTTIRKYNPGIGLLRAVACWLVIVCHFHVAAPGDTSVWQYPLLMLRQLAVPVFMTLTFYFGSSRLMQSDPQWLRQRLQRIGVPLVVWSVVSYVAMRLTMFPGLTLMQLAGQIVGGSIGQINGPLWFMNALLAITLLLYAVSLLPPKPRGAVLWALLIISVAVQYSHSALLFVVRHNDHWALLQLALRCVLMLPYALAGIFSARYDLFGRLSRMPWYGVAGGAALLFAVYFMLHPYDIDSLNINYVGASFWIGCAAMILLFLSLSGAISSPKAVCAVKALTSYTLGIYCMHQVVGRLLRELLWRNGIPITGIELTFLIYPVCYLLCWCIARIPSRWARMLVN